MLLPGLVITIMAEAKIKQLAIYYNVIKVNKSFLRNRLFKIKRKVMQMKNIIPAKILILPYFIKKLIIIF